MSITLKSLAGSAAVVQVDGVDRLKINADGTLEALVSPASGAVTKQLMTAEKCNTDPNETERGMPLVATQTEINAGIDDKKSITSKKLRSGFNLQMGPNGFITFPTWMGGLIIQWGSKATSSSDDTSVSFPMVFPGVAPFVVTGLANTGSATSIGFAAQTVSGMKISGYNSTTGARVVTAIYWIAIGQ